MVTPLMHSAKDKSCNVTHAKTKDEGNSFSWGTGPKNASQRSFSLNDIRSVFEHW